MEPVDYTCDGRARRGWMHKNYYTLVDCNPVASLLQFVLDFLYNLFLHCFAEVGKILTDVAHVVRRAVTRNKCWSSPRGGGVESCSETCVLDAA